MAYTPQEIAAMQAGLDPRAYYQDPMVAARAGLIDPETLPPRGATTIRPGTTGAGPGANPAARAQTMAQDMLGRTREVMGQAGAKAQQVGGQAQQALMGARGLGRSTLAGGALLAVPQAISELQQGRLTGAAGALGGGIALGGIGAVMTRSGNPLVRAAGMALPVIGNVLGVQQGTASAAESVRQAATGKPTKGKEGEYETERARALQTAEDQIALLDRSMGVQTSNIKDLSRFYSDQAYLDMQRMNPLIQKMKNADMVRQQALMNTQGQIYGNLGVIATAGKLATGAQAEMGATVRQALASNPYASATISAPSISFG